MRRYDQEPIGFVFVHGAGLQANVWKKVVEGFGHPYLLIEYPLRESSFDSNRGLSLDKYVEHIKKQVDEWEIPKVIVVAHSLGGILALRLASELNDRLAGIIAVGAVIPKNGGSFLSIMPLPQKLIMSVLLRTLGTKPPESAIRKGLCNDLKPDQATEIVKGFIPEAVRVYTDQINVSVPDVPKLYVKLANDKQLSPSLQDKMISNFSPQTVHSLDTGHLPMISNPDGLRTILESFASKKTR